MNFAIIDLGTNTFHLAIYKEAVLQIKISEAAKLGLGGIGQNMITDDAMLRGLKVLQHFKKKMDEHDVRDVKAIGTSAIRNAQNAQDFCHLIKAHTGIDIIVIDGNTEADYIFHGVKNAVNIEEPSLIVDIGGGSIECIIGNMDRKLWAQSFEIGGLRLMEKFMPDETLSPAMIPYMNDFFREKLLDLHNAIHQYKPSVLIGSSGSFDTLMDMYMASHHLEFPTHQSGFEYPLEQFYMAYESLVFADRPTRMAIAGMIPLRVDMIVVAMVFIAYLIRTFDLKRIKISNYSLLEGVYFKTLHDAA